jgi:hypothetical protein
MLEKAYPQKIKVFLGFIFREERAFAQAAEDIAAAYGRLDSRSPLIDFNFTDYYRTEMGTGLKRKFISLEQLFSPESMVQIKNFTISLETKYAVGGKRTINIDPGYLTSAKLVLVTTKDFAHRVYLGDGVFAEVTLLGKEKEWVALPWTYPDYRTPEYQNYFSQVKKIYKQQLSKG